MLTFNSERFDNDAIHDAGTNPSRLTAKTAGKYAIFGNVRLAENSSGIRQLNIVLNGTTRIFRSQIPGHATSQWIQAATVYDLAVNDYIELEVYQDSGVSLNSEFEGNWAPEFSMVKVDGTGPAGATGPAAAKILQLKIVGDADAIVVGDGKLIFIADASLNGLSLTAAHAYVTTPSSSGLPTVQVRNVTQAADMLTTRITIDASEFTSYTAAAPAVIDLANDDVATGDRIAIDVDVAGTGAKGLGVVLTFA